MRYLFAIAAQHLKENAPMLITILVIVLILALVGGLPTWRHSRSWGYGPSGGVGLILVILLVLWLLGRL
jgi:L-lactate permease